MRRLLHQSITAQCGSPEHPRLNPIATSITPDDEGNCDDEERSSSDTDTPRFNQSLVTVNEVPQGCREYSHSRADSTSGGVQPYSNSAPERTISRIGHWTDAWVTPSPPLPLQSNKNVTSNQNVSGKTPIAHWTNTFVKKPPRIPPRVHVNLQRTFPNRSSTSSREVPTIPNMDFVSFLFKRDSHVCDSSLGAGFQRSRAPCRTEHYSSRTCSIRQFYYMPV